MASGRPGLKRGDVVTVAAGGGFGGKPRPGLIIQCDDYHDLPTVVVALFTIELVKSSDLRRRVDPSEGNGLLVSSDLMTDVMITVRKDRIGKVIGSLSTEDMARIDRALLVFLGLAG